MSASTGEPHRSWPNTYRGSHRPPVNPLLGYAPAEPDETAPWDEPDGSIGCPASQLAPRTDWPINPPYQSAQEESWHRCR